MRSFSLNLKGRVKNFNLPKNRPLIPLYEAIVNSIHAIQERREADPTFIGGKIEVNVVRSAQINSIEETAQVEGFDVIDNGIGFDEKNMRSFLESDSTYKESLGGKGVGRFSWLKAFRSVKITSVFKVDQRYVKRSFDFNLSNLIQDTLVEYPDAEDYCTKISLNTYFDDYKKEVPKQADAIALRVIQHCFIYFLDENCPQIQLKNAYITI